MSRGCQDRVENFSLLLPDKPAYQEESVYQSLFIQNPRTSAENCINSGLILLNPEVRRGDKTSQTQTASDTTSEDGCFGKTLNAVEGVAPEKIDNHFVGRNTRNHRDNPGNGDNSAWNTEPMGIPVPKQPNREGPKKCCNLVGNPQGTQ